MVKKKIKVEELKDGDIFYLDKIPSFDMNEDQLGDDWKQTGEDVILIVDSLEPLEDYIGVYTNGGYFFELDRGTEVYVLGTYTALVADVTDLELEDDKE